MSDHYYTQTPGARHDRQQLETVLRGNKLRFTTDAGVFSKTGIDFGSRVLIDALELGERDRILDVGCGYGPIGITAAKLAPAGNVTMIDVNERAVALANENAILNGVSNAAAVQSDIYESIQGQLFDVIITNPPIRAGKEVVHRIFEEGFHLLKPGGSMWVVIQKKQGAPSAEAKLEAVYGFVEEVTKEKGYRIFRARKEQ
ncbi:class I SAM-dependent methyltransferase [Paenibacillus sacheonensis]|uniref:Methyltransferase n=1 Tax=Paenibacillus sacheonensis TaxID=742054 RepID=A0A7X4YVF4_9BACL|nr:class I SAM-dependent methyltransferase [Paenibacillus sacheonensis]MBM7569414.1 16S rRNA (guanine1207-N2)-methyltransferase [Paenibacillus sacheonensis]NBC73255.1 methyltransferase [Paenibacillus sacheonensis]